MAHFAQRQLNLKPVFGDATHGGVEPVAAQGRFLEMHPADDFRTGQGRVADIGANPRRALQAVGDRQREG